MSRANQRLCASAEENDTQLTGIGERGEALQAKVTPADIETDQRVVVDKTENTARLALVELAVGFQQEDQSVGKLAPFERSSALLVQHHRQRQCSAFCSRKVNGSASLVRDLSIVVRTIYECNHVKLKHRYRHVQHNSRTFPSKTQDP